MPDKTLRYLEFCRKKMMDALLDVMNLAAGPRGRMTPKTHERRLAKAHATYEKYHERYAAIVDR